MDRQRDRDGCPQKAGTRQKPTSEPANLSAERRTRSRDAQRKFVATRISHNTDACGPQRVPLRPFIEHIYENIGSVSL